MQRSNLTVETGALAQHIDFEGKRAVGLTYRKGTALRSVRAKREVV